jgi:hypothetical protein
MATVTVSPPHGWTGKAQLAYATLRSVAQTAKQLRDNPRGTVVRVEGRGGTWGSVSLDDQGVVQYRTGYPKGPIVQLIDGVRHRLGQDFVVTVSQHATEDGVSTGYRNSAQAIDAIVSEAMNSAPGTVIDLVRSNGRPVHRSRFAGGGFLYGAESWVTVGTDRISPWGEPWFTRKVSNHPAIKQANARLRQARSAPVLQAG